MTEKAKIERLARKDILDLPDANDLSVWAMSKEWPRL